PLREEREKSDGAKARPSSSEPPANHANPSTLEVSFRPDPNLWDGRFANNGWLQELPKPLNKLSWDNAAHISPALAEKRGLSTGDVVELNLQGRTLRAPVRVTPGQAEHSVTLTLGYGRTRAGQAGAGV